MPFVKRDENGLITAIYDRRVEQLGEELPADYPEITGFLERVGRTSPMRENLDRSDPAMGRVLEDLIECLIEKRLICRRRRSIRSASGAISGRTCRP